MDIWTVKLEKDELGQMSRANRVIEWVKSMVYISSALHMNYSLTTLAIYRVKG